MTDHLGALGLSPGQRARGPVQGQVAQPDVGERVEQVLQPGHERGHAGLLEVTHPVGQVADLHLAQLGDVLAVDLRRQGFLAEAGAAAVGAGGEGDRALHEPPHVWLQRLDVLGEHRLLDLGDQPLVGEVDALDLDLLRLGVEQLLQLLLGELRDGLVHREPGAAEDPAVPAVHAVAGNGQCAVRERLGVVVQSGQVEVAGRPHALAARAHAALVDRVADDGLLLPAALLGLHDAAGRPGGDVERERRGRADVGLADPAEQDPQHRVRVGGGAHGRARVGAHPLLVDDDRGGEAVQQVDLGPRQASA